MLMVKAMRREPATACRAAIAPVSVKAIRLGLVAQLLTAVKRPAWRTRPVVFPAAPKRDWPHRLAGREFLILDLRLKPVSVSDFAQAR